MNTNQVNPHLRSVWERTHRSKIHYQSRQEAQHYLRLMKKSNVQNSRLEVYPCRVCGQYVIGTKKKKTKKVV